MTASSYARGNVVYSGGTTAPTRGTVDPMGYIDRGLNNPSQARSGLASAALNRLQGQYAPASKALSPVDQVHQYAAQNGQTMGAPPPTHIVTPTGKLNWMHQSPSASAAAPTPAPEPSPLGAPDAPKVSQMPSAQPPQGVLDYLNEYHPGAYSNLHLEKDPNRASFNGTAAYVYDTPNGGSGAVSADALGHDAELAKLLADPRYKSDSVAGSNWVDANGQMQYSSPEYKAYMDRQQATHTGVFAPSSGSGSQAPVFDPNKMSTPYDATEAAGDQTALAERTDFLNQMLRQRQKVEESYTNQRRDAELQHPMDRLHLLNNTVGRGMAYSSGYGYDVGQQENRFADLLSQFDRNHTSQLNDLTGQQTDYDGKYAARLQELKAAAIARLAQQAGGLGLSDPGIGNFAGGDMPIANEPIMPSASSSGAPGQGTPFNVGGKHPMSATPAKAGTRSMGSFSAAAQAKLKAGQTVVGGDGRIMKLVNGVPTSQGMSKR